MTKYEISKFKWLVLNRIVTSFKLVFCKTASFFFFFFVNRTHYSCCPTTVTLFLHFFGQYYSCRYFGIIFIYVPARPTLNGTFIYGLLKQQQLLAISQGKVNPTPEIQKNKGANKKLYLVFMKMHVETCFVAASCENSPVPVRME